MATKVNEKSTKQQLWDAKNQLTTAQSQLKDMAVTVIQSQPTRPSSHNDVIIAT